MKATEDVLSRLRRPHPRCRKSSLESRDGLDGQEHKITMLQLVRSLPTYRLRDIGRHCVLAGRMARVDWKSL